MINYTSYAIPRGDLGEVIREHDFSADGFVAEQVLPVRTVMKKSAYVPVVSRENLKRADSKHKNGSAYNRINLETEDLLYACKNFGLEAVLTDDDRENYAADFDGELETVTQIRHKILVEREIRVKDLLFNTTTWTGASLYTDVSAAPWDAAASAVLAQVRAAAELSRKLTGTTPDSMLIGAASMNNLLSNTGILARFVNVTVLTEDLLRSNMASLFGLRNLFVGGKVYDSAKEGQTASISDIWGDDYALIFKKNEGSTTGGGLGRILRWDAMTQESDTLQYREEQVAGDIFRVEEYADEKVFDASYGHLLKVDV